MEHSSFIKGHIRAVVQNEYTGEIREYESHNIATRVLLNRITAAISRGVPFTGLNKFIMGTGTGTVAKTDAALFTPVLGSTISAGNRTDAENVITITLIYPKNYITGTFKECGLMDIDGILLTHALLSPNVVINTNEIATITYTMTIDSQ